MRSKMHWTYQRVKSTHDLMQGDILKRNPRLEAIFETYRPDFLDDAYNFYMVITQSCDLVIRKGDKCKASFISIAPAVELKGLLSTFAKQAYSIKSSRISFTILDKEKKGDFSQFIDRIWNQNEQAKAFFYLHPQLDRYRLPLMHSVVLLRNTAAIPAEKYETLRKARILSLTAEFQAKLGWLTGNIYSRVGTQDWNESPDPLKEFKEEIWGEFQWCSTDEVHSYDQFCEKADIHIQTKEDFDSFQKKFDSAKIETENQQKEEQLQKKMRSLFREVIYYSIDSTQGKLKEQRNEVLSLLQEINVSSSDSLICILDRILDKIQEEFSLDENEREEMRQHCIDKVLSLPLKKFSTT